ncbi:MAG: phosphoglycerate dehydrogenase [Patescibacteria group bacterium]
MKVLVLDGVAEAGIAVLREAGLETEIKGTPSKDELIGMIGEYDAMIVRSQTKVTAEVIAAAGRLKVIGRAGVGVDNVDVPAATQRGIIVMNAPDGNTISTAEHTVAMIMALSRNIPAAVASLKAGKWDRKSFTGVEVRDKTLGIIGLGRIGTEVARRMQAMGMAILGYDPFLTEERAEKLGVTLASIDDIVARADYITVHTPLTPETKGLLGAEAMAKMKKGVRLINCARGGIIDEAALVAAVKSGKVAGAALDVYNEEPPLNRELIELPQVICTPHLGASTEEAQVNVAIDVAVEMTKALRGEAFKNAVNIPSVRPEVLAVLKPYLPLAEKIGSLLAQLDGGRIAKLEASYLGEIADYDLAPLTTALLTGFLRPLLSDEVNLVNAPLLAKERGLKVVEHKAAAPEDYTSLIRVRIETQKGSRVVAGALFRRNEERIVEIDGYFFDVVPTGYMLVAPHTDKPGIIGKVGTILGDAGINIAYMQVGRKSAGGRAIMVLSVDNTVPEDVLKKIASLEGVEDAKLVRL